MLTNATVNFLEGHEGDECDCPACMPTCERTGRRCFIACDRCRSKFEADEIGPLKSVTKRVHYDAKTPGSKVVAIGHETALIRSLNGIGG